MNAGYEVRRRGRRLVAKEVILQPRPSPSMCEVPLTQELLTIRLMFFSIQLKLLSLDILFSGELSSIGVDVSDYSSVSESDEGIVDEVVVD